MANAVKSMVDTLGYTLSLPERAVRSLVAVAAGATKIVADTVVPRPLRKSRTYAALVGNAQRFLIEKIGEVEGAYEADSQSLPDDYVPRKVAGNVLEAAGMFSVHLSPLWVFAIAADVAEGSRVYLQRLTQELKRDGVIDAGTPVEKLDDLLEAMGQASEHSAKVFDAPPISKGDIVQLRDQLMSGYGNVFSKVGDLMPRIDKLWDQMQSVANTEVDMTRLAGLMSLDLSKAGGRALDGIFSVGRVTTEMLGETILASYGESLMQIQQRGLVEYMDEATRPYVSAFWKRYSRAQLSWTERLIRWLGAKFRGGEVSASKPT